MLKVNVITRIEQGRGLLRDLEVIRDVLEGHAVVSGVEFTAESAPSADVTIHCETPLPRFYTSAPFHVLVPNVELWQRGADARLQRMHRIICKTQEAMTFFSGIFTWMPLRTSFVGWKSDELYDPSVTKEKRFLHIGAEADFFKGTEVLLQAWEEHDIPYPLTVVGSSRQTQARAVTMLPRMPRPAFIREQNRHQFHIVPSLAEGWCHAAHEAAGVGAVLVATAAPPMSDYAAVMIRAQREHLDGRADLHRCTTESIRDAVRTCMNLDDGAIEQIGRTGRAELARANAEFVEKLRAEILSFA